jgi:serine/threonine protein kinase
MAFLLKDYKDIKEIARGGMGKVYLGTQISLNRKVIIKEMASGLLADPTEIRRFENEARAAAALNHDSIIRIYDFGEDRGSFYISMEYIDGEDLDCILKSDYYLPEIGLMIVLQALNGLNFAHQQGIIHRDIKPGNILVSKVGAVKVVDFGLAHASHQQLHLTTKDMIVGTPIFMSPEQATGEERKDSRMDIWATGILLYRIVANAYPFTGENVPALLVKILQNKEPPVQNLAPALPDDLADAINQCLEKNRNKRLQSLEPLIETLQNYFFDMEIKDTSAWIRRYESDPRSCVKDLSLILLEYHIRKENECRSSGNEEKARAHLQEAKKYESKELPLNLVRDAIKKRDTSAIFKKSPRVASSEKTSAVKPVSGRKPGTLAALGTILVLVLMLAVGWVAYSRIAKKSNPDYLLQTYNAGKKQNALETDPMQAKKTSGPSVPMETAGPTEPSKIDRAKNPAFVVQTVPGAGVQVKVPKLPKVNPVTSGSPRPAPVTVETSRQPEAQPTGLIRITVNPASAEVTVNGEKLSASERSSGKRFNPGSYAIIAKAAGYEQFSKTVSLEKGDVQIVSANLAAIAQTKEPGSLHIYSSPWAEVYIDGAFSGNSPTSKPLYLTEGPHMVQLKRSGFKTYEEVVSVGNGELKRMKIKLEEEPAAQNPR